MSDVVIRAMSSEEFAEQVEKMADDQPEKAIVLGDLEGRNGRPTYNADANTKHLGEFVYPGELFAKPEGTEPLESADTRLVATGVFPSKYIDLECDAVLDYDEYKRYALDVADEFRDPVFIIGGWFPTGNYQITGNSENNKPRRCGSMAFEERVFDTATGCQPLNELHLGFPGTIVLEADTLAKGTVEYVRGERDELPFEEREDDRMDAAEINAILRDLSPGDRIQVNDRNRALTVVPRSESSRIGVAGYECVFLSGNGTDYRIKVPKRDTDYPELEWHTDSEYIGELEVVDRTEGEQAEVPA